MAHHRQTHKRGTHSTTENPASNSRKLTVLCTDVYVHLKCATQTARPDATITTDDGDDDSTTTDCAGPSSQPASRFATLCCCCCCVHACCAAAASAVAAAAVWGGAARVAAHHKVSYAGRNACALETKHESRPDDVVLRDSFASAVFGPDGADDRRSEHNVDGLSRACCAIASRVLDEHPPVLGRGWVDCGRWWVAFSGTGDTHARVLARKHGVCVVCSAC